MDKGAIKKLSQVPIEWFQQYMNKSYDDIADIILEEFNFVTDRFSVRKRMKQLGLNKDSVYTEQKRRLLKTKSVSKFSKVYGTTVHRCRNIGKK